MRHISHHRPRYFLLDSLSPVILGLLLASFWLAVSAAPAATPPYVWLEGEKPARTNYPSSSDGVGNPHFLSASNWLKIAIEEDQVEKKSPTDGVQVGYDFSTTVAGPHEIWVRIGYEFVRSPFDWRVDGGEWSSVSSDELTTDLMELSFWTEVAWLKLGRQPLSAGSHTLEFRLPKTKDNKGKSRRILFALDAICLSAGEFHPYSHYQPGENHQTEQDRLAAAHVFKLPEPANPGARSSVALKGLWEICRHDEQLPGEVAAPITNFPAAPRWSAMPVPSDKNKARPDLLFAHRLWYRTRVQVPASMAGRSFYLDFPYNNLNTTVYVNGEYCGFEKNPFAPFTMDVTRGIKPGQVNEIWVGIRDAWYGRSADPQRPLKLRKTFNYPMSLLSQGFQDMDYPVWNCPQSGILSTPTFVAAGGPVYVSDVFVKPSVARKELAADITLLNTGKQEAAGEIHWEAVDEQSGRVEHTFAAQTFKMSAGQAQTIPLAGAWVNPKLWWPDSPHLYRLRTTLMVDGKAVDAQETVFGFREWRREGAKFTLNGVVWHMWADLVGTGDTPEAWLAAYKKTHQRTTRLSTAGQAGHESRWHGLEPRAALEFCDRHGVVVRRNTTLDGETIGYQFSESDAETRKQQGGSELKLVLMRNWRDQCVAQVKGERNHPSIQIWSLENEFAYINLINLLGNSANMDRYEEEITKTHDAVLAVDPTRTAMIDGGGATKKNTLSVHGDHYLATLDGRYPDLAYEPFEEGGGRGRWKWDGQRPRFAGEDFFANGINPADYAMWGGEVAFQGKAATRDAIARIYRMLNEGYRWGGYYAAWHFWLGTDGAPAQWGANDPRAVFVREYDWTFGSGQNVKRTFGVFNDTQYPEPMTFSRRLVLKGREVYAKTSQHTVAPGAAEKFSEEISVPTTQERQEVELSLTLVVKGQKIYSDTKAVSILPPPQLKLKSGTVAVFDPKGEATTFLKQLGVAFVELNSLEQLLEQAKVLVVGRDAISAEASTSTRLAVHAAEGHAIVVLDQANPLKYQAIPAEMELAPRFKKNEFGTEVPTAEGRTAFLEDTSHPALRGLKDKDFFTWGPDHLVFRNAYIKPTRGAKSLVQAGPRLEYTALVEVPVGKGIIYLCQLDVGNRLKVNAVAQTLFANLVQAAAEYRLEHAQVAAFVQDEQLAKALDAIGLQYHKTSDPLSALRDAEKRIALISATPANLKLMAQNRDAVRAFWQRGGTMVLCGLTPEGLADYNQIVGVDHLIRPFKRERVTFPPVRHPLTAGLTTGDIVLLSGKRVFGWTADEYVVSDMFTHVVDLEDIAPFGKSDFGPYDNIVNGFVGSDGWPLIIDFEYPQDGKPHEINIDLPREETVVEYTHDASVNYNPTTRIGLKFDDRERVEFAFEPNGEPQTFAIDPPRKAKRVTLQILDAQFSPAKRPLVGIDNIHLKVQRSPEWQATVHPMLNLGGLVHYAKGPGGVVLCNLKFQETEAVPINVNKKRVILATVLRNLKAPFAGGRTVIAGAKLACTPIDIHTKATTYKDERGWFGDKRRTLKALPPGEHTFAGVKYNIYEMPTSPVPQVLMLGGHGVPGNLPQEIRDIPINTKADALFFLHTARIDRRMDNRERAEKKRLELCKYVVQYDDGQTMEVPVYSEIDIAHYQQEAPVALPGAQLAWTSPFEGAREQAAVYAKQWNNPRPDVRIKSVDLVYGKDKDRGVPVLIAITAATAP